MTHENDTPESRRMIELGLAAFTNKCAKAGVEQIVITKPLCVLQRAIQEDTPRMKITQAQTVLLGMLIHLSKEGIKSDIVAQLVCNALVMWTGEQCDVCVSITPRGETQDDDGEGWKQA